MACIFQVVRLGFEPRQTESETVMLPLHHRTMICVWECNVKKVFRDNEKFLPKIFLKPSLIEKYAPKPRLLASFLPTPVREYYHM